MNICVLIVTYNRLEKLKKCLKSYDSQTRLPNKIIVVDNGSNKETKDFLSCWINNKKKYEKVVLTLNENFGGSGGFYYGMKKAVEIGFDWLWVADDDAYVEKDAFYILDFYINTTSYKIICGKVYNENGIDLAHRRKVKRNFLSVIEKNALINEYNLKFFKINIFSFVGSCFSYEVIKNCGLPKKDYFIWYDDTEYSYRVNKNYEIICVPKIEVFHDSQNENNLLSWKNYYGARNYLDMCHTHFTFIQFKREVILYKLMILKNYFFNKKKYYLLRDAMNDFLNKNFGISVKYKPGSKL